MDMTCGIFSVIGVILVVQWFIILFYCRFKFKTRYTLATIITFMTMFVYIHLAFNCFHLYGEDKTKHVLKNKDYDPRVRSINEDFRRELLHTYEASQKKTNEQNQAIWSDNQNIPELPGYENTAQNHDGQYTFFNDGGQRLPFDNLRDEGEQSVQYEGEVRGDLATNRRKEDVFAGKDTEERKDEEQWQRQWNANIPSVHAALNGLQNDMENFNRADDDDDSESYNTEKEIIKNLASNIYNDPNQATVPMTEYQDIVRKISYKTIKQEKYINSLNRNKTKAAWDQRKAPLTVQETLKKYSAIMPWYEQEEIVFYKDIWYLGLGVEKIHLVNNITINYGFDYDPNKHDNGEYIATVGDHVAYRYEIIKYLGSGSYGVVVRALDHATGRLVAIKFMVNERDWWDGSILREMRMMLKIEDEAPRKNYFPRVLDHFLFRNHKCVVMELLGESMYRHHRKDVPIHDMKLLQRYAFDILNAMADLQSMHIIHGDLKPDNIMYLHGKNNRSSGQLLKVADFGLGCVKGSDVFKCKENHLQTRYYRCPEVMFSLPYDTSCDMFSVGVILAEFYLGKPPFWGETNTDQVAAMMEVLGLVPPHMIEESPWQHVYRHAICYVTENGFKRKPYRKPLTKVLAGMPDDYFDLIRKCLLYEPDERITAIQALQHPFMLKRFD